MVDEKELKSRRYYGRPFYFSLGSNPDSKTYLSERGLGLEGMHIVDNPFHLLPTEEDVRQEGLLLKLEQAKKKH